MAILVGKDFFPKKQTCDRSIIRASYRHRILYPDREKNVKVKKVVSTRWREESRLGKIRNCT
jgi:hypothetical protein